MNAVEDDDDATPVNVNINDVGKSKPRQKLEACVDRMSNIDESNITNHYDCSTDRERRLLFASG